MRLIVAHKAAVQAQKCIVFDCGTYVGNWLGPDFPTDAGPMFLVHPSKPHILPLSWCVRSGEVCLRTGWSPVEEDLLKTRDLQTVNKNCFD